mmetsp:Transcript_26270/g.66029  ORF Transcript_26270/g.66029 Transcript_26270/m.66029 type:complete len:271 (+) Transcript_26270:492-1304(+)
MRRSSSGEGRLQLLAGGAQRLDKRLECLLPVVKLFGPARVTWFHHPRLQVPCQRVLTFVGAVVDKGVEVGEVLPCACRGHSQHAGGVPHMLEVVEYYALLRHAPPPRAPRLPLHSPLVAGCHQVFQIVSGLAPGRGVRRCPGPVGAHAVPARLHTEVAAGHNRQHGIQRADGGLEHIEPRAEGDRVAPEKRQLGIAEVQVEVLQHDHVGVQKNGLVVVSQQPPDLQLAVPKPRLWRHRLLDLARHPLHEVGEFEQFKQAVEDSPTPRARW